MYMNIFKKKLELINIVISRRIKSVKTKEVDDRRFKFCVMES